MALLTTSLFVWELKQYDMIHDVRTVQYFTSLNYCKDSYVRFFFKRG
jgi:hypothetical protein